MEKMQYTLYICGCRGSRPVSGREFEEFGGQTSCFIIKAEDYALVIDCGTGLYDARQILADCAIIDVFLTHVHYDHILGLLDWTVFPKEARVSFYAAFKNWFGAETLNEFFRAPFWPVQPWLGPLCEVPQEGIPCQLGKGISVSVYPAPHPNGASLLHICLGSKRICVMFDCESPDGMPAEVVKDCDMLVYDGMYENEAYPSHIGWGHSTWQEGCRLSVRLHPKMLLISHHDPCNTDVVLRELEQKAQTIYPQTHFARSGEKIEL